MEKINQILANYDPISLSEMDSVALLNRVDTKFITDRETLASILEEVREDYKILEIKERRINSYETLYFDTKDYLFYNLHHRGKNNRFKFRKRKYVESDMSFLEIKFKNNKKRTIKSRVEIEGVEVDIDPESNEFIESVTNFEVDLVATLMNTFSRITLVNRNFPERLTIDLDLAFDSNGKQIQLKKLVIVEAKQEKLYRGTPFLQALKKRQIRIGSISKYCTGMAMTHDDIKKGNFKQRLKKVNKIENGTAA